MKTSVLIYLKMPLSCFYSRSIFLLAYSTYLLTTTPALEKLTVNLIPTPLKTILFFLYLILIFILFFSSYILTLMCLNVLYFYLSCFFNEFWKIISHVSKYCFCTILSAFSEILTSNSILHVSYSFS